MMFKMHVRKILALIVAIIVVMPSLKVKSDESNKVLILYDSYKEYGGEEGKLTSLIKISLATNNEVKIKKLSNYERGELDYYKGVIILSNEENSIGNQGIEDAFYYKNKSIFIGRNSEKIMERFRKEVGKPVKIVASDEYTGLSIKELENASFIGEFSEKNLSYFIFRNYVVNNLRGNKDQGKNYLMIDKVYAITNLRELMDKIDYLYSQGIRFIFSIMPVYENANLKAMRNYTEVLRYAQSKGGVMFFHSADIYREGTAVKDIYDRMKLGYSNYINYHVYPLALDIPENWLYFEDYKMIFNKTNTLAMEKGKNVDTTYLENYTLRAVENFLEEVDLTSIRVIDRSLINQNLIFTIPNSLKGEDFKKAVSLIRDKNINISDPRQLKMRMEFNESEVLTNNINGMYLNESIMDLKGSISQGGIKDNVTPNNQDQGFSLKKINSVIIIVTVAASVLFVLITFISRRIDKKKYFK